MRIAIAVVIVIGALALGCAKAPAPPAPAPIERVDLAGVDHLTLIAPGGGTVALAWAGGAWRLTAPVDDAADPHAIGELVAALGALRVGRAVATDPAAHAGLGVADGDVVRVGLARGTSALPTLWLGAGGRHLRFDGRPEVYTAENLRRAPFERDAAALRDRRVVAVAADDVRGVRLTVGTAPSIVARRTDARAPWTLAEGGAAIGASMDPTVPEGILQGLLALEARDRADGRGPAGDADARARIELERASGPPIVVRLGAEDGDVTWLSVDGQARATAVPARGAAALVVPAAAWRDRVVVDVAPETIVKLEVTHGRENVSLTRAPDKKWIFGGPAAADPRGPDQAKAQAFALTLRGLRARAIGSAADEPALANPRATVTITTKTGKPIVLELGASAGGLTPARVTGRPGVVLLADADAARLLKTRRELMITASNPHDHE